ncbi:MAG: glycosyltransferase [Candidatus Omnitrophica bacterium]|nr:glycosyltransferase [Candidatus Omnitrophota bacterium]
MDKTAPLVSIIVVNYNRSQYLKACFEALAKLNYPAGRVEILMVDNCSDDDSVSFVKNNFPKVRILENDINNYARANNLGVKNAKGDFIAFINNDIQVSENWLSGLVNAMSKEKSLGAAGGKILLEDGKIQSTGHEEYPDFYWGDRGFRQEDKGQYERPEEVLSLCGAAVLFRKSCLKDVGFFDEDFIMYLEDVDMCFRCTKHKWKVMYVPESIAKHYFRGTSSAESVRYFSERNRLLLVAKHFPEQLGKALYGKGYFTQGKNNIYDIFPLIFMKLFECQKIDALKANLPVIFKNLKNISTLEKSILMDEIKNLVIQKEASLAEFSRVNNELACVNTQLDGQIQKAAQDLGFKDKLLKEKEACLAELTNVNAQLHEQIQKALNDIGLKNKLLQEKEASLAEFSRVNNELACVNTQLDEQIQKAANDLKAQNCLLLEKQDVLDQKEIQLHKIKEELMVSKDDLEKIIRLDQKIRILLIKPQRVTVEDTEEVIRIIKKKYPHSAVYLFSHLLPQDYEKLAGNNNLEKSLIYGQKGSKSLIKISKLYSKLFLTRFDLAVALLSHQQTENYAGYKKAKLITILSNSRNQCFYYVD